MNPYAFVRWGKQGQREPATRHDQFKGYNGRIACRLTALTHLFIPKTQEQADRNQHVALELLRIDDGRPLLPGSSLKGVLRNVAEALSGSCLILPQARQGKLEYRGRPPVVYQVPQGFERCRSTKNACPACRLFGLLSRDEVFVGKLSVSDATAEPDAKTERMTIEALMEPKPRHRAWYGDPKQRELARGRKFYYHQPAGPHRTTRETRYNKTIEPVVPGTVFEFEVEYTNLTADELALLVFSLVLEESLRHKAGMGKPVGLGSVQIEIVDWTHLDPEVRYRKFGGGVTMLSKEQAHDEMVRWREAYHQSYAQWAGCLSDLKRIWSWDPNSTTEIKYPGQEWFRKNPETPLEQAP
jgi:CRISPR/Cas system CSM-associated protein Csm3 (group 7 of RAMP superfamily)